MWGAIGAGLLGSYLGSELDKRVLGGNGQLGAIAGGMAGGGLGNSYLDSGGAVSATTEQFAQQGMKAPDAGVLNPAGTGVETGGGYVPDTAGFDPRAGVDKLGADGNFLAMNDSGIAGQEVIPPETYLGMTGDQWGQTALKSGMDMAVNQTPPPQTQAPIAGQGITQGQMVDTKGLVNLSSNPFLRDKMRRGQY